MQQHMSPSSTMDHFLPYYPSPHPAPPPPIDILEQMSSFPPQQQQRQPSDSDLSRARAYKSRNKRPCDFCRYKKAACHLENAPPCELCIRYNKECTFVESPAKRRRPNDHGSESGHKPLDGIYHHSSHRSADLSAENTPFMNGHMGSMDMQQEFVGWDNGVSPAFQLGGGMGMAHDFPFDPALYHEPVGFDTFEPMSASTMTGPVTESKYSTLHKSSTETTSPQSPPPASQSNVRVPFAASSGEPSLDRQSSSNAQIVGLSGESDPYLLAKYRYDENNEAAFQSIRMRKMYEGQNNGTVPTFFTIQHNALVAKAQPQDRTETTDRWRRELEDMVSNDIGKRMIRLFHKYVQPYFPVLRHEASERDNSKMRDPSEIAPCVLAAIYGHAIPFCAWDEKLCVDVYSPPSADILFKLAWQACQSMIHTPTLAVVQALLLLVQRRPTNKHVSDTPFKWLMMSTATSIAQALGLNRDPTDWPLPIWEIRVRKRLAWAVYVQDKWLALTSGRSSHIHADDWDIPPLIIDDFAAADRPTNGRSNSVSLDLACQHFIKLCELTVIVDDILHDLFSLKATRHLHNSLEATLEVAKPLRIRLTEWNQSLPPELRSHRPSAGSSAGSPDSASRRKSLQHELDGNGSLHLAYITAKIELFRAMLRTPVTDANAGALTALRTGALAVAREVSEFLEALNARELEAFWASYARNNFTIASSFLLLLFVTSPSLPDAQECLALLHGWRGLLRVKSRSCDLLNVALLRLDAVFVVGIETLIELSPSAAVAWAEERSGRGN